MCDGALGAPQQNALTSFQRLHTWSWLPMTQIDVGSEVAAAGVAPALAVHSAVEPIPESAILAP
jgi:hypothetical protein